MGWEHGGTMSMQLHGGEAVVSRDAWRIMAEREAAAAPAMAEHTRDRGDECACPECAADELHVPTATAALWRARRIGDAALVAALRTVARAAARRRRA